jgi:hypothetical protein
VAAVSEALKAGALRVAEEHGLPLTHFPLQATMRHVAPWSRAPSVRCSSTSHRHPDLPYGPGTPPTTIHGGTTATCRFTPVMSTSYMPRVEAELAVTWSMRIHARRLASCRPRPAAESRSCSCRPSFQLAISRSSTKMHPVGSGHEAKMILWMVPGPNEALAGGGAAVQVVHQIPDTTFLEPGSRVYRA